MDTGFGSYLDLTLRRFNRAWEESADFISMGDDFQHASVLEIELDPLRTRKRIKTPLLVQATGDIHKGAVAKRESKALGACNRCLLRFPCIMVTICIFLGMFVLLYLILILPSCGALLKDPNCILWRTPKAVKGNDVAEALYQGLSHM